MSRSRTPSRRVALVLAALALATAPLGLLPAGSRLSSATAAESGGHTVPAPNAGEHATVTVSKVDNLVNETVDVSWGGFDPSSATRLYNSAGFDQSTTKPVRVYECRGVDPVSSSECYGAPGYRGTPAVPAFTYPGQQNAFNATPDGPPNWQDTVTGPDGSGEVTLQVFTKRESAALGCDVDSPCTIVVVPNYGKPDTGFEATEESLDAVWAWDRRTVVPLHFLPTADSCPVDGDSVDVEGSPFAARLLASWRARTCVLPADPVRLDYTAIGEPQTREDTAGGANDTGLTIEPLAKKAVEPGSLAYAPVAATSLVVAYQIDDAHGRPVRELNLNARLVAKLVTASYRTGGNDAVSGNPFNLFSDPEFLALNPGVDWPDGAPGNHPLLLGDLSDSTVALTRWLQADPDARSFLAGTPDPWGMRVNDNYRGIALPFGAFPVLDEHQSNNFEPVQELDALARKLSIAQFPGAITTFENGVPVVSKPPRQNPGSREVIGIIDAASAADFRLSAARLLNAGGAFVGPDPAGVLAGIQHSVVGPDKVTRQVDLTDKTPTIYPLSLLITSATSLKAEKPVRDAVSKFLDYAAGAGQQPGDEVGQLPGGYVPLPPALVKQIRTAQSRLAVGYVAPKKKAATAKPSTTGAGASAPAVAPPAAAPPAAAPPAALPVADAVALQSARLGPQAAGRRLLALPLLLALGILAALAGPLLVVARRFGRAPGWVHR
ncbi:hypothetical protein [Marmoricola sp. URHA0025 HA25]